MSPNEHTRERRKPGIHIRIDEKQNSSTSNTTKQESQQESESDPSQKFTVPSSLQWIPNNWTWPKVRPAIRCALAGWLSGLLFVIPAVERYMGQASFIILITAFLSPPSDPFLAVVEREIIIVTLVAATWAWCALGIFLASLARTNVDYTVTIAEAVTGEYIEAAPTVILAVFIFIWTVALLFLRVRQGTGPYLMGTLLACICLDITITTSALLPFPNYNLGRNILMPLGFHSCIAVVVSLFVFPQTVSADFTTRLQAVVRPLIKNMELHRKLKDIPVDSKEFAATAAEIRSSAVAAETALVPLAVAGRLLPSDLIYSRFSPMDYKAIQDIARRMAVRANGLTIYFSLIDPTREKFPMTPAQSRPGTPGAITPPQERNNPLDYGDDDEPDTAPASGATTPTHHSHSTHASRLFHLSPSRSGRRSGSHARSNSHFHNLLHSSLLNLSRGVHKTEQAVGLFESQRYMDIEATMFHDDHANSHTQQATRLLFNGCDGLLELNQHSIQEVCEWLGTVRKGRFAFWRSAKQKKDEWQSKYDKLKHLRDTLSEELAEFRQTSRLTVIDPYRAALDASSMKGFDMEREAPSHRYLFHCYVYQYHLMRFSTQNLELLDEIIRLEEERSKNRIWTPVGRLFRLDAWSLGVTENAEDEDPDMVEGLEPEVMEDLGIATRRRDPDALPPKNRFEWVMSKVYVFLKSFGGGNALYAIKAGILTTIMCIPSFLKDTAPFAYKNRFQWAIVMGQLTLARFRGDTTFGLTARVLSTFGGGLVGACMWYISSPSEAGNPYGLAAVFAVCFPFFFFIRLYAPIPPMTNIIFFVTVMMVVGYSYQDGIIITPGSPGLGIDVAWRRFVLVTCGVTAAFLFSFLPPATTIRSYQRRLLATTGSELGAIYCSIISFASTHGERQSKEVITSLIAIRSKLNRSAVLKQNAIYEFSLRGRWPAKRYAKILELQLQLSYSLSHLMSVIEQMDLVWTRAFLMRTRFLDPNFQGDLLAVVSMIATALRTGEPLPQITPCPLVDRFYFKYHGFNVIHKDAEDDFGLPRSLTVDTLENEQYLMFCVAASTAFAIVSRLDRLMLAVKEIVGEQYPIHGVNIRAGVELGSRTATWQTGGIV